MRTPILLTILSVLIYPLAAAETHRLQLLPREGEKFKEANYDLWLPDGVDKVKAIILHQHGCGDGAQNAGRTASDDLHWRLLAEHSGAALLGSSLWPKDTCRDWCNPDGGSGRAFLEALDKLAEQSGHAELREVPWVVWGHSGGGFWAHRMLREHPDRFAGAVLQSAGFGKPEEWPLPKLSDKVPTDVPMLIHVGKGEDGHERFNGIYQNGIALFEELRAKGAPVALAIDPKSGHDCGDCRYLTIPWILTLLSEDERIPIQLRTLADGKSHWMPSEAVAKIWSEFTSYGKVIDKTPPAHAPTKLDGKMDAPAGGFILTWDAKPDLQSGIKTFKVYVGDQLQPPYTTPGKKADQTTTHFRKPNYSDTPDRPLAEMRYVIKGLQETPRIEFRVSTVNWAGLESEKSEPLVVTLKH